MSKLPSSPSTALLCLLAFGCGPTVAPTGPTEPTPPEEVALSTPPVEVELPALSEGACGGFSALQVGGAMSVLQDRVRVPALEGARRPAGEPAWSGQLSLLRRELGEHALLAHAYETYRTAPRGLDLAAAVRASVGEEGATVLAHESTAGAPHVLVFADPVAAVTTDDGFVQLLEAYVRAADRSLVRIQFRVSPAAFAEGGCERVALALATGAQAGSRQLELEGGTRSLLGGLTVEVPAGTAIERHHLGHWTENYVHVLEPMSAEHTAFMMVRSDSHPGRPEISEPTTEVEAPVLGQVATWRAWEAESGRRWRDVIVPGGPAGNVWVAIGAETQETVDALTAIAGTVAVGTAAPTLASCDAAATPPPAPTLSLEESSPAAAALALLLQARELQTAAARSAEPAPTPVFEAMRALFRLPGAEAAAAFRHLAENATPAGRLYGLVGLYQVASSDFDAVACGVRGAVSTPVQVADLCAVSTQEGGELLESPGPNPSSPTPGLGDIRSGTLARDIYAQVGERSSSPLAGGGWAPPLAPDAPSPVALVPGDRSTPRHVSSDGTQIFWTTRDGRMARTEWGRVARWVDVPVRFPADYARGRNGDCVLDTEGRRACWGRAIAEALGARRSQCQVPVPEPAPHRVFDDGPWAELVLAGDVCGIHADDRSLRCFRASRHQRTWGATAGPGLFGSFRMPIVGRVIGVFEGQFHSQPAYYASTEDGALHRWDLNDAPAVIHRFESPVVELSHVEGVDFVRLRDGRVFARGLRSVDEWWGRGFEDGPRPFVEVPLLQGHRIHPASRGACLVDPAGRTRCWGYFMDGTLGPVEAGYGPPAEITAYSGAEQLFIHFGMTCARTRAMQMRCADEDIAERLPGRMRDGFLNFDLDRLRPRDPE